MSLIADWLSEKRIVELRMMSKSWERREQSHRASFAAWVMATYSASVVDKAIISCYLALHETALL